MAVDRAAGAVEGHRAVRGLAGALLTAVADAVIAEPAVVKAVARARRSASGRPAVVSTENGNVTIRAAHPAVVSLELPCDASAGAAFRAGAAVGGPFLIDAANAVESGNMAVGAVRGALGACTLDWPRDLSRLDAATLGPAAKAAMPFLRSVRCEGIGETPSGPITSLRLFSDTDDRPVAWTAAAARPGPGRNAQVNVEAAAAALFREMFNDPVFRTRFGAALQSVLASGAAGKRQRPRATFTFQGVLFDLFPQWVGEFAVSCQTGRATGKWWSPVPLSNLLTQVENPCVSLGGRLGLAAHLISGPKRALVRSTAAGVARDGGIGALCGLQALNGGGFSMEFKLPDHAAVG